MQTEAEIIAKVKKGDQEAFAELYKMFAEFALRTAAAVTKSKTAAADAVQETFMKVFLGIDSFNPARPFRPWLYVILLNECKRVLKNNSKFMLVIDSPGGPAEPASFDSYPIEAYEDLYRAIQSLHDLNRIPLILKYLNDFTEKEIACILGVNLNTIKSRLHKGRQKLKKALGDLEEREKAHGRQEP